MAIVTLLDADLDADSGALVLVRGGERVRKVPIHDIEEVHVFGRANVSTGARNLLLRAGIDTVFLTMDGRVRGRLVSSEGKAGDRRLAQYAATQDGALRLRVARRIVTGKVANQRGLLLGRQRSARSERVADALVALRGVPARIEAAADLDTLRGIEGEAAARYFAVFGEVVRNAAFTWPGRTRRPPRDPLNACLSYGYTLLFVRCAQALRTAGLDPYLGLLHEAGRGKEALALDLAEVFRPLVDGLVLTLVNRAQLGPEDFGPPDRDLLAEAPELDMEGAVYLGKVGRTIFLRAWAARLADRSPHPTLEGDWSVAGLLGEQAHGLRRALLDGEAFVAAEAW